MAAWDRHISCRCDSLGLDAGVYVEDLHMFGAGCTSPMYVCPALDAVRRHYEYLDRNKRRHA